MKYHTYIMYSTKMKVLYIGSTGKIGERIRQHNSGYETYTKKGVPWVLWAGEKCSKSESYVLERAAMFIVSPNRVIGEFFLRYQYQWSILRQLNLAVA